MARQLLSFDWTSILKLKSITGTGGHAKLLIQSGDVSVNGEIETRRRRKLVVGDVVEVAGEPYSVTGSTS